MTSLPDPIPSPSLATAKKILLITSSGGGGLLQTATAKEQEAKANDPSVAIIRADVLKDWLWKWVGKFCVNRWNGAQIRGDVAGQKFCVDMQFYGDYLFWVPFFLSALKTLYREEPDTIVDTQPMGTSAILLAVRIYNRQKGKNLSLQKVLVDLPTKKATHFFAPIKALTPSSRRHLRLTTIAPLLEEGQTPEEFWRTHCCLEEGAICYEEPYVRQAFKAYRHRSRPQAPYTLKLRTHSEEELTALLRSAQKGSIRAQAHKGEVHFHLSPEERIFTVLLGSQPASQATFHYVKKFLQLAKEEKSSKGATHLFVFCSHYEKGGLFTQVVDLVASMKNYPSHFSVIPFSFQKDDVVAPLFFHSTATCTRSGGQTAMELMCVSRGEIWIHSEAKCPPHERRALSNEELLHGIPGWESENAVYLQKMCGAKLVTPEGLGRQARRLLRGDSGQAHSNRLRSVSPLQSTG